MGLLHSAHPRANLITMFATYFSLLQNTQMTSIIFHFKIIAYIPVDSNVEPDYNYCKQFWITSSFD